MVQVKRRHPPQPTPRPWKSAECIFGSGDSAGDQERDPVVLIWPASMNSLEAAVTGSVIAETFDVGDHRNGIGAQLNAALIVRACNAHDELLAALRCVVAAMDENDIHSLRRPDACDVEADALRELIVRSEGN